MDTPTPRELALQAEVQRLRDRLALLEGSEPEAKQAGETSLKAALDEAVAQKNRLEAVLQALPAGVALIDLRGRNVECNAAFEEVWRGPRPARRSFEDMAAYKAWWADRGNPVRPGEWASARAVQAGETVLNQEMWIERFDGTRGFVLNSAAPIRDARGQICGSAVAISDITELKQSEAALRESEQQLASIYNTVRDLIFYLAVEPEGQFRVASVNAAFLRVTGLSREVVVGKTVDAVIPEPSLTTVLAKCTQAIQEKTSVSWEETSDYPRGRLTGVVSISPVFDKDGVCTHLVGSVHDITGRKHAEARLRESEERFRTVADTAPVMIWMSGVDTFCTFFNRPWLEFTGRTAEQELGNGWADGVHPDDMGRCLETYLSSFGARRKFEMEYRLRRYDGEYRWLLDNGTPLYREGEFAGFIGSCIDITERKHAEQALHVSEVRFRTLANAIPQLCWMATADGSIYWHNQRSYDYTGATPEQLEGWGWQSVYDPEILPQALERWKASIATGAPFEMVLPLRGTDGAFRPFLTRVVPLHDRDGHVSGWVGTHTDISEQSKALEALAASERLYRAIGESIDYGVWVCDPDGRNTYTSESFLKLVGMTQEQCSNFGWGTVLHPEDAERTLAAWKDCVRTQGHWSVEYKVLGVDGEWHPILARGVPVRDEQGRIICWAGINLDISALKRAEEETRRANAILDAFFAASPAILNIDDEELRYLKTDSLTASYFGLSRDEIVGRRLSDLAPDFIREFGPMIHEVLETGRPRLNVEVWAGCRDMGVRHWMASYFAVPLSDGERGLGVVGIDITENKRAEERLRQAQKLESLGRLAGGLAHDFNNLMNVMIIYADSALDELQAGESATQSITEIRQAAEKAVEMGRQLMAFSSSKQEIQHEVLNLNPVLGNSEKILRRLIGEDVKIICQPAAGLRSVKADRGQITQILMNLAVNARDAMPDGGTLVIKTENVELDAADLRLDPGASPGPYVMLMVRDTGMGMDKATQARIFEPFFTTKDVGKGTGLGLSVVYGIVRQNGGFITVASEPGDGTEFKIYLPAAQQAAEAVRDGRAARVAGGSETILLVEDEPALRNKIQEILGNAGYDVLAAPDGNEAFRLSLTDTRPIHLLLTDMVMPAMSGTQLARRIRDLRPETKVLFVSGYPDKQPGDGDPEGTGHFLPKPFSREKLLRRVREVLDGVRAADVTGTEPLSPGSA